MSRAKPQSGSPKTVAVPKDNQAKALAEIRHAAHELLNKIFTMSEELDTDHEGAVDVVMDVFQSVNIPGDETDEIEKRAKKQGKSFAEVALDCIQLGLDVAPDHLKAFREYSEHTGRPLDDVLNECLDEYREVVIETEAETSLRRRQPQTESWRAVRVSASPMV